MSTTVKLMREKIYLITMKKDEIITLITVLGDLHPAFKNKIQAEIYAEASDLLEVTEIELI